MQHYPSSLIVRASQCAALMTNGRSKSEVLSETCKSMIEDATIAMLFGQSKEFSSKYTDKGITMEQAAIEMLNRNLFRNYTKNEKRFNDGRFAGTPDIIDIPGLIVRDTKCSWDRFTFPWTAEQAAKEVKKGGYEHQVRCYMMLTGAQEAWVDFVLLSTPEELLRESGFDLHDVDSIPEPLRISSVFFQRDEQWEEEANTRWEAANGYYLAFRDAILAKEN